MKVQPDVFDPDPDAFRIGGWQGRIVQIRSQEDGTSRLDLEWERITLRTMPHESIERCEEEGLDWTRMGLYSKDLELAEAGDTQTQVHQVRKEIEARHSQRYRWLGEEGKRIGRILAGIDLDDELARFERWEEYLEHHLRFPFEAVVKEWQERGPFKAGDQGSVKRISRVDELYGVIVARRVG